MTDTIFHKIARGESKAYTIYEDDNHLAFLDIFPITKGQIVVIPKTEAPSKLTDVNPELLSDTVIFSQLVAKKMEATLPNVRRVILIIEGMEIDYFHVKLIPTYKGGHGVTKAGEKASDDALIKLQQLMSSA